jgi:hypothetical protein
MGRFEQEQSDYVPGIEGKKTVNIGEYRSTGESYQVELYPMSESVILSEVGPKKDLTIMIQWPQDATSPMVTVLPLGSGQPKTHSGETVNGQEPIGPNHSK